MLNQGQTEIMPQCYIERNMCIYLSEVMLRVALRENGAYRIVLDSPANPILPKKYVC